jgi:hypothetical protein
LQPQIEGIRDRLDAFQESIKPLVDGTLQAAWRDGLFKGAVAGVLVTLLLWVISLQRRR